MISWVEQYTVNNAYKNGFGWVIELAGFSTFDDKENLNNFSYINNSSKIVQSIISDHNVKFNSLTGPFWQWHNQSIPSQNNWQDIFQGMFLPLAIEVQRIWVNLIEQNYHGDLYSLFAEDFSKKHTKSEVLTEGFGSFSSANWIVNASYIAANISGENAEKVYPYFIHISDNYFVGIASNSDNQNLVALVEAYNASYYRLSLSIMQYIQYAYNIHALGIMMYYRDPHVYQAVQYYLGNNIIPASDGNYEHSIEQLNLFYKNNYIDKLMDLMGKFRAPTSSEKILRNHHGLELSDSFINHCQLLGFYKITERDEFLIESACTENMITEVLYTPEVDGLHLSYWP